MKCKYTENLLNNIKRDKEVRRERERVSEKEGGCLSRRVQYLFGASLTFPIV
jgi:hypothetical protein